MISPAPAAHNSSGLRPVAAAGAGVQFAAGPIHGMRTLDSLPATTMQNGTGTGPVAFTFRGWSWLGHAEHCKAGHGAVWRNVTPRNGDNFSGLGSTCLGWARQRSAGCGNIATRGGIAGQFPRCGVAQHGVTSPGRARRCNTRAWRGIQAQFSAAGPAGAMQAMARRGATRRGYTLPRAESGTISQGKPGHGLARLGDAGRGLARLHVTVDGNHGHFPNHQEAPALRGATVDGMTGSV